MATIKYWDEAAGAWKYVSVSPPDAPVDGSQYARKDGAWSKLPVLPSQGSVSGFRNRVINPNGAVQVRASTATVDAGYACDRWVLGLSGGAVGKGTSGSDFLVSPDFTATPYAESNIWVAQSGSILSSPAAGDVVLISQRIALEQIADFKLGTAYCKPMVLSFVARTKSGMGSFTIGVSVRSGSQDRSFVQNVAINETAQKYTIAIPAITSGVFSSGAGSSALIVTFSGTIGATYLTSTPGTWVNGVYFGATGMGNLLAVSGQYFRIREVQLEEGTIATPFEVRSMDVEQDSCARYFQKSYGTIMPGVATTQDGIEETVGVAGQPITRTIRFHTRMRAYPNVLIYDAAGNVGKISVIDTVGVQTHNITPYGVDNTSPSSFKAFYNGAANIVRTSFHWTANCEIS